jgi:hypothetical protein
VLLLLCFESQWDVLCSKILIGAFLLFSDCLKLNGRIYFLNLPRPPRHNSSHPSYACNVICLFVRSFVCSFVPQWVQSTYFVTYLWILCLINDIFVSFLWHLWHVYDHMWYFMAHLWHVYDILVIFYDTFVTRLWHICDILWHICDPFMTFMISYDGFVTHLRHICYMYAIFDVTFMTHLLHVWYTSLYICFVVLSNFRSTKWSLSPMFPARLLLYAHSRHVRLRHCYGDRKASFVSCVFGWRQ